MGKLAYNLNGVERTRKYLVSASFPNVGVIACGTTSAIPLALPTTTAAVTAMGLTNDTAVYSAVPAAGATGIVTVSYHPDNVYAFRASGSAVAGVSLGLVTETAGDVSTPDTITGTLPTSNSMVGGTVWRYHGEGQDVSINESRMILTHTSTTSLAVTDDFEYAINIGDQFIMVPWSIYPGSGADTADGQVAVQFGTIFTEVDGSIATGTGALVNVVDLIMRGITDTYLLICLPAHAYRATQT